MNTFKVKTKTERDRTKIIRFFAAYSLMVGSLWLIFLFPMVIYGSSIFTFTHFLISALLCLPLALLYNYVVERIGSSFGGWLSGWTARQTPLRETLSADLERARYCKREARYHEALDIIEEVLLKDPGFPEALYLKGHILWEGFQKKGQALVCFRKVTELSVPSEAVHQWALNAYHEIKKTVA